MGNSFSYLYLAPSVPESAVRELALRLKKASRQPFTLTFCDLEGRRLRKPHLKLAQERGVKRIEPAGRTPGELVLELATATFGEGSWLLREGDDEGTDICIPGPRWIKETYGPGDLSWLLRIEEEVVPWNRRNYHALPGNPDDWDVTVPIAVRLLTVARPLEPRPCPACGATFASKRQDLCQCPHCGNVSRPFPTREDALTIEPIPVDAWGFGQCKRCMRRFQFTSIVEQCHLCGRLVKAVSRHDLELEDNVALVERLLRSI
jgi:hypothetical protein